MTFEIFKNQIATKIKIYYAIKNYWTDIRDFQNLRIYQIASINWKIIFLPKHILIINLSLKKYIFFSADFKL